MTWSSKPLCQHPDSAWPTGWAGLNVLATGDEVEDLAQTFNELLDRVHARAKAVRQFVAEAGHELCTALASLRVCLDLGADAARVRARAAVREGLVDV